MRIINLTQTQFRNYSNIHPCRNFGQAIEYTHLTEYITTTPLFLGLVDNQNNIYAATLILIKQVSPAIKEAYSPNGFLIDYADFELVNTFIQELRIYLQNEKITYLLTDPMFYYKIYNKNNILIENNESLLNNLIKLDFKNIGYKSSFEKYDLIINNNNSIHEIYKNFNRNTKRNIKESINMGITLHKGKKEDLEIAYQMIKKKSKQSLTFYQNLMHTYNTKDNKMEIFFTKLNPENFLINIKKLYESEKARNEQIHQNLRKNIGHISEKLLNKKINSDSLLEKYSQLLNSAIKLNQKTNKSIIIGTSIIIRNNREIYFLIDGYNESYRYIYSSHILKWAIIKKYYKLGYNLFNLGELPKNYLDKNSKYYGMYRYKLGFGGKIIEYPPNLLLVINKTKYNTYVKLNKFIQKKKS